MASSLTRIEQRSAVEFESPTLCREPFGLLPTRR
jgi:hypothetical protein